MINNYLSGDKSLSFRRFLTALLACLFVFILPFAILTSDQSAWMIQKTSYWAMALILFLFVWVIRKELKLLDIRYFEIVRNNIVPIAIAFFCTVVVCVHFSYEYRILFDEYVLGGTSLMYHTKGEAFHGSFLPFRDGISSVSWSVVDKRPCFFPFILSLIHGLFGYSPNNVFALNTVLSFCLFLLVYGFVASVFGRRWGVFCQLVIAGLPLLGLSATSGGYEVMNLCFITVLSIAGLRYLRSEGVRGLDFLVMSAVVLANCRYESIIYSLIPILLFVYKSLRDRRLWMDRIASIGPVFMLYPLMNNRVFYSKDAFFQTSKEDFFGLNYLIDNTRAAFEFVFDFNGYLPNSLFISLFGGFGLLVFVLNSMSFWSLKECVLDRDVRLLLISLVFSVLLITVLALSMFWGAWTDIMTSRFSLPLHLLFVFLIPFSWHAIFGDFQSPKYLFLLPLIYLFGIGFSLNARQLAIPRLSAAYGYNWILKEPPSNWSKDETLVVSEGSLGAEMYGYYSIPLSFVSKSGKILKEFSERPFFSNIVFAEYHEESPFNGEAYNSDGVEIPEFLILETEDERRFLFDYVFKLSRLTGMKMPVPEKSLPVTRLTETRDSNRIDRMSAD